MISVVITTCNRPVQLVKRAVESVLAQTYRDWELIVVDDSPQTYVQRPFVKQYVKTLPQDYRITYVECPENRGANRARNMGLARAAGEYIAYLDDDDEWLPEKLEKQLQAFQTSDPRTALVYCSNLVVDMQRGSHRVQARSYPAPLTFEDLLLENYIGGTSIPLLRTSCVRAVNGFDEQMPSLQDMDLWLRLVAKYPVVCVAQPLVKYYLYPGEQITNDPVKKLIGVRKLYEKNKIFIQAHPAIDWHRIYRIAFFEACNRQLGQALVNWGKTLYLKPVWGIRNLKHLYHILEGYGASFVDQKERFYRQH